MENVNDITIGLVGYQGKMGQEILNILKQKNINVNTEGGEIGGDKTNIFKNSNIVIDFTNTNGLQECLNYVEKYKTPFVSGSTAMTDEIMQKILELSKNTRICWSANMSIGVAITKKLSSMLGGLLKDYDCEILEKHHNKKKDAPSGTAIMLGQAVAQGRKVDFNTYKIFNRTGLRKQNEIGFSSIRGGNIFGEHDVMFIGENDEITISHKAYNRKLFAIGAVECALKLLEKKENGFYKVEDLIF